MSDSIKKLFMILILCLLAIVLGLIYIFSPPQPEIKRIGILLYQSTPTTINFVEGLKSGLNQQGYYQGRNLILLTENAGNTEQSSITILERLKRQKIDLLITTGKDLTIAAARALPKQPIIFALVSDPIRDETIKNLVEREKKVTGVSYFTPYDRTLELSKRVIPNLKRLTVILPQNYTWPDLDKLKTAAADADVDFFVDISDVSRIESTIAGLHQKTDAVYLPNDLQLIMQRSRIQKALYQARIPAISNNLGFQFSSVLTYFADPKTMGAIAGQMAVKIFHGANTEYMTVELSSYFKLVINRSLLEKNHIPINKEVLNYANEVIQ